MKNNLPKRKTIRLNGYDYSTSGYYFITICTHNRQQLFWKAGIVGADSIRPQTDMQELSEYGNTVDIAINAINSHYHNVTVDKYIIMPNHIHMILRTTNIDKNGRIISAPTIMTVIGQMKRCVSKEVGFSIWQKSYYEHIIRDENDYRKIWEYIDNNIVNWDNDRYYN